MNKKVIAVALALVLVVTACVAGTLAWLTAETDAVVNTFTAGNIGLDLEETERDYKMVPGIDLAKDPTITVKGGSEACWLFVKVEENNNVYVDAATSGSTNYFTYDKADGWNEGAGGVGGIPTNVWYRVVGASDDDQVFQVLAGGEGDLSDGFVHINENVTKDMLDAAGTAAPTLTFTAYACQKEGVETAADAWAKLNPST